VKVILGVTGSVAATLTPKIVKQLKAAKHEVQIIATEKALYFFRVKETGVKVWLEKDEWPNKRYMRDESVGHIKLRDWADLLLIAPLSANTLVKMANGLCDNLLTSVVRAWDLGKPVVAAPAMNTKMWNHPVTQKHLAILRSPGWYKLKLVNPVAKRLACGDEGVGAMADINDIIKAVNLFKK